MDSFIKNQRISSKKKGKLRQFRDKPVAINITMGERDANLYNSLLSSTKNGPKDESYSDSRVQVINEGNQPRLSKAAVLDLISSKLQVRLRHILFVNECDRPKCLGIVFG
jgi:hypothetical protein